MALICFYCMVLQCQCQPMTIDHLISFIGFPPEIQFVMGFNLVSTIIRNVKFFTASHMMSQFPVAYNCFLAN